MAAPINSLSVGQLPIELFQIINHLHSWFGHKNIINISYMFVNNTHRNTKFFTFFQPCGIWKSTLHEKQETKTVQLQIGSTNS